MVAFYLYLVYLLVVVAKKPPWFKRNRENPELHAFGFQSCPGLQRAHMVADPLAVSVLG